MIEKYTSIYTVLDKIRTDIGEEAEYRWSDIKNWVAEFMQKIATQKTMVLANTQLQVTDHRAKIPCNVVRTIAVSYENQRLRYGTDVRNLTGQRTFKLNGTVATTNLQTADSDISYLNDLFIDNLYVRNILSYDESGNLLESQIVDARSHITKMQTSTLLNDYYTIDGEWYKFSFESGLIEVDYLGVYLDEEGFPYIPDSTHLREAMYLYVLYKLVGRGFQHPIFQGLQGVMALKNLYEEEWVRAKASINMPSWDEFRGFIASYVKLIPDIYRDDYYRQNSESRINERTSSRQSYTNIWRR